MACMAMHGFGGVPGLHTGRAILTQKCCVAVPVPVGLVVAASVAAYVEQQQLSLSLLLLLLPLPLFFWVAFAVAFSVPVGDGVMGRLHGVPTSQAYEVWR